MSDIFMGEWSPANPLPESFLDLPAAIYRDWPLWPGEDREKVQQQFSLENPWFNHSKAWIGCIPGKTRLAGFLVPHAVDGQSAAFFGFWETDNDIASNTMLFSTLEQWTKKNGAHNLYGPINFSTFGHYRVRLDHFDVPPFENEPYNPPYYSLLLEKLGFNTRYRYTSLFDDTQAIANNFRQDYLRAQKFPDPQATLLPLTPELWMQEQVKLYSFIDSVFGENFAYTTPSWTTFQHYCGEEFIKPFCLYPASFLAKTVSGEITGLILSLSVSQQGQPAIGLLKTVAVAPQYRGSRLYHSLYHSYQQNASRVHPRLGGALMREDNKSLKTAERLFNTPASTRHQYALYYRRIA
ncbi:hypothetical protein [Photorhabdus heterorhabditis]|uniref:hypothetical protein n=1 Tax=Photorhabdus heterorhabditis TaxID=880156 RepID=UPI0015625D87|nr:hypothetical protein [Photorhabdus heterorhabditis]NRN27456.1 hypothetical protein [Photorhabdus heterorhabditis subsp. aluminescens]